jgi:lipid-A-disaccharide synthase
MTQLAVVAGEASGDQLGADLIEALRRLQPGLEFVGIAGPAMRGVGCEALFRTEDLSVMGLSEVLRHLPRLLRIRSSLAERLRHERPAAFVGIDSPDFNLSVAARLRATGIPTVQYVCPSVWAWRQGRVRLLRDGCDRVLCLLPFEAPFLATHGVRATFVGHPFADRLREITDTGAPRRALGIHAGSVVGLLPGSRVAEVVRLGTDLLGAAARLQQASPGLAFAAALATPSVRRVFEGQVAASGRRLDLHLIDGRAREVIAASDIVLAASGTVTLEAMLIGRPMVVAYRFAPLTYWTARLLGLVKVRHFALPNLLAGEALVPEFLQGQVTPEVLAGSAGELLRSSERREFLRKRFAELARELRHGASEAAARAVLEVAGLTSRSSL